MNPFIKKPSGDPAKQGLKLKILGVGGAGCKIAEHLNGLAGDVEFYAINADVQALNDCGIENRFAIGSKLTGGLGTGADPERGREAALEDTEGLESLCKGADIVFVLAGLGGGTGTGAAPLVAATARKLGALVLSFVTLPFDCEGTRRQEQAENGIRELQKAADGVVCLPNQKVFKLINEDTSVLDTFKTTNDYVAQGIRAIWKLVSETGFINLDFADLCDLVRGRDANSSFATVDASGPQRVRDAVDRLLAHPLLDEGAILPEADTVLVSLCGSSSLSMSEVDRLMELLGRTCEKAQIKMGATIDDSLDDRIAVTVIAAHKVAEPEVTEETEETNEEESSSRLKGAGGLGINIFTGKPGERRPAETEEEEPVSTAAPVRAWRRRRRRNRTINHPMLPLDMMPKGPFENAEPTLHNGEDLDVPTFVRRGMILN